MSPRRPLVPFLAAAVLLGGAVPAQADAPWSEPVTVPGLEHAGGLVVSPSGRSLLTSLGPGGYGRRFPDTSAAPLDTRGAVGPARVLARNFDAGGYDGIALDARGGVSAIAEEGTRSGSRLVARMGSYGGALSRRRVLAFGEPVAGFAVASNTRGDQAVLFQVSGSSRSVRRRAIYLSVRRAGGAFRRAVRIARGPDTASLEVAMNDGRQVVASWARNRRVAARRYSASGRLARAQTVGRTALSTTISAAVAPGGRTLVAWAAELGTGPGDPPRGFDDGPYAIRAAPASPGAGLGPPQELEVSDSGSLAARPVGADRILLAYGGEDGDRRVVRTVEGGPAGIGPAQTVSSPDDSSRLADLASGPRGEAVVSWYVEDPDPNRYSSELAAAVLPPGATSFSAPESVVRTPDLGLTELAIDPASGRVLAAFDSLSGPVRLVTRPPIAP
jgi:hypothetical protein